MLRFVLCLIALSLMSCSHTKEQREFYLAYKANPKTIGAIRHSSVYLSKKMTDHIASGTGKKILEVGAGIGSFSEEIIGKMDATDHLDLIEIESPLCKILEAKFTTHSNVSVHCTSILDFNPVYQYDYIVSGLPFNYFSSETVQNILNKYVSLSKPENTLSFFEYIMAPSYQTIIHKNRVPKIVGNFVKKHQAKTHHILMNTPPARIYKLHLRTEEAFQPNAIN